MLAKVKDADGQDWYILRLTFAVLYLQVYCLLAHFDVRCVVTWVLTVAVVAVCEVDGNVIVVDLEEFVVVVAVAVVASDGMYLKQTF